MEKRSQILFAHYLRGICAIIVVFQHYFHDIWIYKNMIYDLFKINFDKTFYIAEFLDKIKFNFGHLAVDIFFIISGFVICMSVERYSRYEFFIQRVFRIYPTYIMASIISFMFIYFYQTENNLVFQYEIHSIIPRMLVIGDFFGYNHQNFDLISWTLEKEIKFYILCIIMFNLIKNYNIKKIAIWIGIISVVGIISHMICSYIENNYHIIENKNLMLNSYYIFDAFRGNINKLQLFATGIFFYFFYKNKISRDLTIIASVIFILNIAIFNSIGFDFSKNLNNLNNIVILSQSIFAILIFFGLLLMHMKKETILSSSTACDTVNFKDVYKYNESDVKKSSEKKSIIGLTLNYFANLSYSIYVCHGIPGLIIINLFEDNIGLGILISVIYSFIMANILHFMIEKKFIKIGKQFTSNSF
jgi:peptidoglycan/LPS O-acetylase OafA/YrhL